MTVYYCRNCSLPVIVDGTEKLVTCVSCHGRYFGNEPPRRMTKPVVISADDRRFLHALRIAPWDPVADATPGG